MYSGLYQFMRKYIFPGHREIRRSWRAVETSQWLTRAELEEVQLKKIQRLVSYACEHVPFYRERYQREDIHPQDIKSFKDFQALPFLTRDDVIDHREDLISPAYRGGVIEGKTSGSTGRPLRFIMDRSAGFWSYAVQARCRGWYGIRPGDKMAWVIGILEDCSNWCWRDRLANRINRCRYLNARTMNESEMQAFASMLVKWQPAVIRAYPSALSVFAYYLKEQDITNITPKLIEITAEKVTPLQQQLLSEFFQAPLTDHYSSLEIRSIAHQCPEGGLHVMEERYLELVGNGRVVNPGHVGEVVVTALNQYAMPFIRYKNGDVGIYESDGCSCGRGMPVLREVVGRNCDLLVKPDGKIVHWTSASELAESKEVYQYQIYQPDRTHIEVRLVCRQRVESSFLENIRNELQPLFGDSMHITVKLVDHIELMPGGKHRYVISEVKPDSYN